MKIHRSLKLLAAMTFLVSAVSLSYAQPQGPSQAQRNYDASVLYHNTLHQQQIMQKYGPPGARQPGNFGGYVHPFYGPGVYPPPGVVVAPGPAVVAPGPVVVAPGPVGYYAPGYVRGPGCVAVVP
jgi:hypothetical protein